MGSLLGHLLPGTFFISFSLWWIVSIFCKYFNSKLEPSQKSAERYENTATFKSMKWPHVPLEAFLKLLAAIIGIIAETVTGFKWIDNEWKFANIIPNGHHIVMFSFFALNAVADLATFYKIKYLPKDIDYVFAIVASAVECYLFANHLHGRQTLDVKLHTSLVVVIVFCIVSSFLEMIGDRHDVRLGLFRSCCYLWQGTWFFQTGIVLYPPKGFPSWDVNNMRTNMIMDLMFMGHLMGSILIVIAIGISISLQKKREYKGRKGNNSIKRKNPSHEYTELIPAHDAYEDSDCVQTSFA